MFSAHGCFEGTKKYFGGQNMKKVLLFLFVAMFLVVPMSFAKTAITDKYLGEVTAQEGVTINFNCFTVGAISIDVQSWGDSDGCVTCGGFSTAGWVGASVDMSSNFVQITGNMTIDVGTSGTRSALIIGLPSLNLAGTITQVVKLSSTANLAGTQVLGTSYMSGVSLTPSGYLTIFAH
jgi:hypothetical protein